MAVAASVSKKSTDGHPNPKHNIQAMREVL